MRRWLAFKLWRLAIRLDEDAIAATSELWLANRRLVRAQQQATQRIALGLASFFTDLFEALAR